MTIALIANRAMHRRQPGGWSPKELGTLSAWFDADDATTVTISTGVSQWDDKSGNGRNVTQGTGSRQPEWAKGTQNGRAVLRFDGGDWLTGSDDLDLGTGNLSGVAAFKYNATSYIFTKSDGVPSANGEWGLLTSEIRIYMGGALLSANATNSTAMQVRSWVADRATAARVWHNGTAGTNVTSSPIPNTDDLNISTVFQIGSNVNGANLLNGDLCEIIVSLSALSTSDREKCEGYLAHKWGLAGNLPAGHTYKSVAP